MGWPTVKEKGKSKFTSCRLEDAHVHVLEVKLHDNKNCDGLFRDFLLGFVKVINVSGSPGT